MGPTLPRTILESFPHGSDPMGGRPTKSCTSSVSCVLAAEPGCGSRGDLIVSATMDGAELQELLRTLWPDEVRLAVATATGFHQHRRRLAEGRREPMEGMNPGRRFTVVPASRAGVPERCVEHAGAPDGRRGRLPRGGRGGLAFDARGAYFFFRRIHTT